MANPSPAGTAHTPASTTPLEDGFSTKITIAADADIDFWEKSVTPPGVEGGDAIETTTMHSTTWRTFRARALKTATEVTATVAYDPVAYDQIVAVVNNDDTTITIHFPNGDTIAFYGYLRSFIPNEMTEGAQPEAVITIVPTQWDVGSGEPSDALFYTSS